MRMVGNRLDRDDGNRYDADIRHFNSPGLTLREEIVGKTGRHVKRRLHLQAATCSTILPRACLPSIISWALRISASGSTVDTTGMICSLATSPATVVNVGPTGGVVPTILTRTPCVCASSSDGG